MKKGFSLIESLIVISIIAIVVGIFVFINNTAKSQAVLDKAQTSLVAALQEARNKSAAGFGSSEYGVHIEENKIVIFKQGEESQGIQTSFPSGVSADQDLTVLFERLNALPDIAGDTSIILKHSSGLERTITITKDGSIDY
jgi:prepilin-type N-terminal cleavage/methylation domain-containing protein